MIDYLKRGVLAGGVAGGAYGLFLAVVANPLIESIHQLQHDHSHAAGESTAIVAESTTNIVSVGGGLLWGIFLGGLFALAFFLLEPAVPGSRAVKPYLLSGMGFLTVSVTPWLVLPPATPASEQLYSVDVRLAVYGGLVLVGAAISVAAVELYRRTAARHQLLRIGAGLVPIVGTIILLPLLAPPTVSHPGLSTDLVVTFQAMVAVGQAGIWLLIAATFGWLQQRDGAAISQSTEPTPESV
jgi:hypothetical protein